MVMRFDDPYQSWVRKHAQVPVPDGFADRVLERLYQRRDHAWRALLLAALLSRPGKVALWSLAGAACLVRLASIVTLFLPS
jgi:hypothetical protein